MSEPKLCCNCLHCARWRTKDGIKCHCDLDDKYLGYLDVMDEENDCKHWEKEAKWDLQREHDAKVRADALEELLNNVSESIIWDILAEIMKGNIDASDGADKVIDYLQKVAEELKGGAENE